MGREVQFVGREPELDALVGLLSRGGAAVLHGEEGIGKTRLAAEVGRRLTEQGHLVLSAGCLPLVTPLPLLPVLDLLRTLYAIEHGDRFEAVLRHCPPYVRHELVRLLPEQDPLGSVAREAWAQERLFTALSTFWLAAGEAFHAVLVIDDVQWSDESSRDFLTYLVAHSVGSVPLLLTASSNPSLHERELRVWAHRLPQITSFTLGPLSPAETTRLAEKLTPLSREGPDTTNAHQSSAEERPSTSSGNVGAQGAAFADLWRRTGGNPALVDQLVANRAVLPGAVLTTELADGLRARTTALAPCAREVLHILAVAGLPLTEHEIAQLTDQEGDRLNEALLDLVSTRLVERLTGDEFAVRPPLLAEAVVQGLLVKERSRHHAGAAVVLAARGDPSLAVEVAEQWRLAGRPTQELAARVAAAEHAERTFTFGAAAAQWERAFYLAEASDPCALEVAVRHVRAAEGAPVDASTLALRGVAAWASAGDEARGADLGRRGLRLATRLGRRDTASALRARLAHVTALTDRNLGLAELTAAVESFEGQAPSAEQVRALVRFYHLSRETDPHDEQQSILLRAVGIGARDPHIAAACAAALSSLAYEQLAVGDIERGLHTLSLARRSVVSADDPEGYARVAAAAAHTLLQLNRLNEAVTGAQQDLEWIRTRGHARSFFTGILVANLVEALLGLGQVNVASGLLGAGASDSSSSDGLVVGPPTSIEGGIFTAMRSLVDVSCGDLQLAADRLHELGAVDHQAGADFAAVHARIVAERALWAGEPGLAVSTLETVISELERKDEPAQLARLLVLAMRAYADLAEAAVFRRDAAELASVHAAADVLRNLVERRERDPFAAHAFFVTLPAEGVEWRAESGRALQSVDPAQDQARAWETVAVSWEELGRPHRAAYARWRQAQAQLRGRHERPAGSEALRSAWQQSAEHEPLRHQIAALARTARVQLRDVGAATGTGARAAAPATPALPFSLTSREVQVLRLLSEGLTNAQIGERLYMSPKTASVHVTAILRKLHATNRVHAAAIAERTGLAHLTEPGGREGTD